jgi:tRNA threonylcarbamoyladenosine biosynthesis protein TsaE
MAEGLSESRLEIAIVRGDAPHDDLDPRRVEITPVGPRWHALSFRGLG